MEIREFCKKNGLNEREVLKKIKNRDKYHWNGRLHMTADAVQVIENMYKIVKKPKKASKRDSKKTGSIGLFA